MSEAKTQALMVPPPPPTLLARFVAKFLQPKTSPQKLPVQSSPFLMINQMAGRIGPTNASTYRAWSIASPWVRAAIDIRRDQVASAEWDIVPRTVRGKPVGRSSVRLADEIRTMFEDPNPVDGSFQSFVQRVVEDVLVLDAGSVEKVRYPNGRLAELWPTPGDYIRVDARWDGSDPDKPRYFWYPDGTERASFTDDDMMYVVANARSISPVGVSPLEILKTTVDSELQATEYNRRQVMGAAPDGIFNIGEDAPPEKVQEAKSYWEAEVFGKSAMGIVGGFKSPSFMKFRDTNREMQFREWEDLLIRAIAIVYGLSPMDLSITFDVNRSTAETQQANTEDRGLRPLMSLLQEYFTRYIVWDKGFGGRNNNLAFRWTALNLKETAAKASINKIAVGGTAWKTVNEARIDDGREPLGDVTDEENVFNHPVIVSPKGVMDLQTQKYLGEEDLAQIGADAQMTVDTNQIETQADNAPPPPPAAAPAAPAKKKAPAKGK